MSSKNEDRRKITLKNGDIEVFLKNLSFCWSYFMQAIRKEKRGDC